ncbi:MAG: electron transport complex subunit RsxC [Clostridia bacterium]|nr:electron transport complex subunit RsxC [Clostridia bacterium]MBQ8289892.1 electron transport complex subunit RsxC [Clostridia bacterium]
MLFSLHGIHVPHRKNTADMKPVRMVPPETVTIPMSMHIGKPADPVVKVGDKVYVGTLIGAQSGFVSAPVYSSVSGTVAKLEEIILSNGTKGCAVVIKSDGEMTPDPEIKAPTVDSKETLIEAIKNAGTVGLGGAGFPSYIKFNTPEGKHVDEMIINGAECEPYITSDTRTMIDKTEDIRRAIDYILRYVDIGRVIIGIENNKPKAIEAMRTLEADERITVKVLPSLYPQGGEKVLVYHTTGKVIPAGKLPLDVGCIVVNVTTLGAIGNYIATGMPIVSKCVTVDGSAVKEPKNLIVPIGTKLSDVYEFAGGFRCEPKKVLLGGPMMGIAVPTLDTPVMKNTNATVAFDEKDAAPKPETACIRCGGCANHCPVSLNPAAIMRAYKSGDTDALAQLRVDICMECGCCSYTCPAGQRLVETNKLSKALLREEAMKKKEAEKK